MNMNKDDIGTQHRIWQFLTSTIIIVIGLLIAAPLSYLFLTKEKWYFLFVTIPVGLYIFKYGKNWTNHRSGGTGVEKREW